MELEALSDEVLLLLAANAVESLQPRQGIDSSEAAVTQVEAAVSLAAIGRLITDRTMLDSRERHIVSLAELSAALGGASVQAVSNRLARIGRSES